MADVTSTYDLFRGLLRPDWRLYDADEACIDADQSVLTQGGPRPGDPVPQQVTEMSLEGAGTQAADKKLRIQTIKAGFPGVDLAGFAWRDGATPDPLWRGQDVPSITSDWECARPIASGAATTTPTDGFDTITLQDDTRISAYGTTETSPDTTDRVQVTIRNPANGNYSHVTVKEFGYAFGAGRSPHPCFVELDSGRLLCFYYKEFQTGSRKGDIQVDMSYSDDSGATWTVGATNVLPADILYEAATTPGTANSFKEIGQMSAEVDVLGNIGLFCELWFSETDPGASTTPNVIRQYASSDVGSSFAQISQSSQAIASPNYAGTKPRVVRAGGFLIVAWCNIWSDKTRVARLASAFEDLTVSATVEATPGTPDSCVDTTAGLVSGQQSLDSDHDIAVADDGTLYLVFRDQNANQECATSRSIDNGLTWEYLGQSSVDASTSYWNIGGASQVYPEYLSATWHRSRLTVVSHHEDAAGAGSYDDSVDVTYLGGPSTVTRRSYDETGLSTSQTSDEIVYVPHALPTSVGWTGAGAGTESQTGSALRIVTAVNGRQFNRAFTSALTEGIAVEHDIDISAGADHTARVVFNRISIGDGATHDFAVEVRYGGTTVVLWDTNAGAEIASATVPTTANGIVVRVELFSPSAGNGTVRWWTRARGVTGDREWTARTGSTTLNDKLGAGNGALSPGTNDVLWGHASPTSATSNTRRVTMSFDEWLGDITDVQANPGGLHPRNYAPQPVHVDGGTRVIAVNGQTFHGDTWHQDTRYDKAIERILPWLFPSPRRGWEATDETEHKIAFELQPNGEGISLSENALIGFSIVGGNWRTASLEGDTDGAGTWATIGASFDAAARMTLMKYVRHGNVIIADASSTNKPYLFYNECVGWTIDLGSGKLRRVLTNTEGKWNDTGKFARVVLADMDGTEPASGTAAFIPTDFTVLFRPNSTDYAGYRLVIDAQSTVDGKLKIGSMVPPGPVAVFSRQYSEGRVLTTEHNVDLSETDDWIQTARRRSPSRRAVELSWDYIDSRGTSGSEPDPDFLASSTSVGADAVAAVGDTHLVLEGLSRLVGGGLVPVVYLPVIARGPPNTQVINRRMLQLYGRLGDSQRLTADVGDEDSDEGFSTAVTITELV